MSLSELRDPLFCLGVYLTSWIALVFVFITGQYAGGLHVDLVNVAVGMEYTAVPSALVAFVAMYKRLEWREKDDEETPLVSSTPV